MGYGRNPVFRGVLYPLLQTPAAARQQPSRRRRRQKRHPPSEGENPTPREWGQSRLLRQGRRNGGKFRSACRFASGGVRAGGELRQSRKRSHSGVPGPTVNIHIMCTRFRLRAVGRGAPTPPPVTRNARRNLPPFLQLVAGGEIDPIPGDGGFSPSEGGALPPPGGRGQKGIGHQGFLSPLATPQLSFGRDSLRSRV